MGAPAIVQNDRITGSCPIHQVPSPSSGAPQPAPPMPFSAPLATGLSATVKIDGKPAATIGSSGKNTPPHVGLHGSDPYASATMQEGRITAGSPTVRIDGQAAANATSAATCCATPGTLIPTVATVLIG
jgi:uncharacterized Zn-binding protein involved in type VI secretion